MANPTTYTLNGATTVFQFAEKVPDAANLIVEQQLTGSSVWTLVAASAYTVTGVGDGSVSVSVEYLGAAALTGTLRVTRDDGAAARLADYDTFGAITPSALGNEFDFIYSIITTNTTNIATNVDNIDQLSKDLYTTPSLDGDGNANLATPLETLITTNIADIATNVTDIATNVTNIATNTTNIATNTAGVATNVADIATNVADIASNDVELADHETRVSDLESDAMLEVAGLWDHESKFSSNVPDPTGPNHLIHKKYFDDNVGGVGGGLLVPVPANPADDDKVLIATGGTSSWALVDSANIATDAIVDAKILDGTITDVKLALDYVEVAGDTMSGDLAMGGNEVTGLPATPSATAAASKEYVDAEILSDEAAKIIIARAFVASMRQ